MQEQMGTAQELRFLLLLERERERGPLFSERERERDEKFLLENKNTKKKRREENLIRAIRYLFPIFSSWPLGAIDRSCLIYSEKNFLNSRQRIIYSSFPKEIKMGKRNNRRLEAGNGNMGCMWGLIRMLHFRRDPKMLLDQREGSRHYFINRYSKGIQSSDFEEIDEEDYDMDHPTTKPTVKKLMEKEMTGGKSGKRKIPSDEIDKILADWGHKIEPDNKKSKKRRPKSNSNSKPNPISNSNTNTNLTKSSDLEVVLASFLVEIYRYHNECELCKNKNGLCPTLKSIVCSKLNDLSTISDDRSLISERHLSNTGVSQSKEFMNALDILSSNRELFLKILQDPDSHVLEKIHEINEKRDLKRFSMKKEEEEKTANSPSVSKIVVLKPKATARPTYDAKVVSHFSFREIKRRLKQIIGESVKEKKDPYLAKVVNGMNKPYRQVHATDGSSFYEEAKKHLTEILSDGNESQNSTGERVSVPLGKILCLTDSNLELNLEQKVEKEEDGIETANVTEEGLERVVSVKDQNQENSIKDESINSETLMEACIEEMTGKGTVDTTEIKIENSTETISIVDAPAESINGDCTILRETSKEDPMPGSSEDFKQAEEDLIEESVSIISHSGENSLIEWPECQSPEPSTSYSCKENYSGKTDQPSPISVLEPFCSDDAPSPSCKTDHDKVHEILSPSWSNQISVLEDASARTEFIESVLESSGLCQEENLEIWYLEEELLEPSFFNHLDISSNQEDDSRFLFDCICEVLTEIQHRYFRFSQQSHVRRRNLLPEVCQGVSWHLRNKHPYLLDHLIRSDLDHGKWCDLREETEGIVAEIWDELIDDLLEETVFDLWL
ncbi:Phosphatidylinositol N-acetyglucosaminlytransferase subunit P-like protein [Rhynchospora pubera]|uniref:Phosphatidylinositol N-acetyglucosaminlytransferase subunit P-like protein n=1 Tax=Rhynchospora pubera TaxID=906938 RepID=A0AAV8EG70_9POAL|nr:Phosphatidylinositol N-acetyglucosaminlytransferase subunit P-like protein [Rhynchospora pubera]